MYAAIIAPHPALLGPFAILLLSIAIFPLILRQHWERHYQKLCALLAGTTCGYYVFVLNGAARVQHAAGEYATFIVVVGTFFVVAGAIHLHIPRPASPLANVTFLFSGSILANFIGTIGASMLLLRPFLHMNRGRGSAMHVAFFIFTIGNLGGALLPVGPHFFSVILRVCRFYGRLSIAGHNGLPPPLRCSAFFLSQIRLPTQEGPPRKCSPLVFIAMENGISARFSPSCSFSFLSQTASANP